MDIYCIKQKVGCGAIGCELLKLFALLGVGRNGQVIFVKKNFFV
jgi:molybdopterin/thiamine biosynthesis adenylyltransferase